METYNDLLLVIEKIKNEPVISIRIEALSAVKELVNTFAQYIRTVKSQIRKDPTFGGLKDNFIDSFFGSKDFIDHELKLKELRKKVREISTKTKRLRIKNPGLISD